MSRLDLASCRVLVVDDDPVNREVVVHLLDPLGCTVEAAADGLAALAAHRERRFDLILMDCEMPGLDGYAATRRLRAEEQGPRTTVLALSAASGSWQEERCRDAGMDGLLAKPLRLPALRAALAPRPISDQTAFVAPVPVDEIDAVREVFGADFPSLARLYLQDGPPRVAGLQRALADRDCAPLSKLAHALGGSSASIGAIGLSELCRDLEACAAAGKLEEAVARLAAIESEFLRVAHKLHAMAGP